jgi:hypothetical protein
MTADQIRSDRDRNNDIQMRFNNGNLCQSLLMAAGDVVLRSGRSRLTSSHMDIRMYLRQRAIPHITAAGDSSEFHAHLHVTTGNPTTSMKLRNDSSCNKAVLRVELPHRFCRFISSVESAKLSQNVLKDDTFTRIITEIPPEFDLLHKNMTLC